MSTLAYAAGGDVDAAWPHYESAIGDASERQQWREAAAIGSEWGRFLRGAGRQEEALEALDRAGQLSDRTRARTRL